MRSDPSRDVQFVNSQAWRDQKYLNKQLIPLPGGPPFYASNSFSGHEANRLFLSDGVVFEDISGVSGADHRGDGRGFAVIDFDRDGWQDIVLYSTNYPRIKLMRNLMGDRLQKRSRIEVQLKGANRNAGASSVASAFDPIGCVVLATYKSGRKQARRLSVGEGNVAQNSSLIWFGQTEEDPVLRLDAKWPSGKRLSVSAPQSTAPIEMLEPPE